MPKMPKDARLTVRNRVACVLLPIAQEILDLLVDKGVTVCDAHAILALVARDVGAQKLLEA